MAIGTRLETGTGGTPVIGVVPLMRALAGSDRTTTAPAFTQVIGMAIMAGRNMTITQTGTATAIIVDNAPGQRGRSMR